MRTGKHWIWAAAAVLVMSACSKDKDNNEQEETIYNKLVTVENFNGDTASTDKSVFYYSLELNETGKVASVLSAGWDISFSGTVNTGIGGNNGADNTDNASFGSGGPGKGGVMILDKPFDEVTKVPDDAVFSTKAVAFGLDTAGSFGAGMGWCVYDFAGNLRSKLGFGGNGPNQAHTCWARPDRTIIVRTAAGNYAKVKIISLYKDAPEEPETTDESPFFTFQYVIAAPGTTDFTEK